MIFRELNLNDYKQFKELINDFRKTEFNFIEFKKIVEEETNIKIFVMEDNKKLLSSGTILFEKKFIHNISLYCHIEDIIVKKEYQARGIGKLLIENLINVCKNKKAYKILLDCETDLIPFYEKSGFINNGYQMVIYI